MGSNSTWLLVPAADETTVLARMRLRPARPGELLNAEQAVAQHVLLPSGWTLLIFDHYADSTDAFRHEPALAAWSRGTEILGLDLNESANYSFAWSWQNCGLAWSLCHVLDEGQEHLDVRGAPPSAWETVRDKARSRLRADEGGDLFFDVPVDALALRIGTTPYLLEDDTAQTPLVRDWPEVDAATRAALPPKDDDDAASQERIFRNAARGWAGAQEYVGIELLMPRSSLTAAKGAMAQVWLAMAAEQGLGAAQALLGDCMVAGAPGFQRDVRAGLQWLELSAAQDHPEGLARLADLLFRQSVTQRQGRTVAVDDPASRARLQRMLALLERGVERGHPPCLIDWALHLHDGFAASPDLIAAKAAMRMARLVAASAVLDRVEPGTLALFDPLPEEREAIWELTQFGKVGLKDLVQAVRARRRDAETKEQALQATAQAALAAAALARAEANEAQARLALARAEEKTQGVASAAAALAGSRRAPVAAPSQPIGAIAALLLGIGLFLAAVTFASQLPRGGARVLMFLAGLGNAWGAWQLTGSWAWRTGTRTLLAALLLVPVIGLLGAITLLWRAVRRG